ncbi:hypothetical protein QQ045_002666 [Rhodiola kirilowii]
MDLGDHQQVQEQTNKTVALCVVLILCTSIPASVFINQYLVRSRPKQNDGVEAFQFNLLRYYDAVLECAPEDLSIGLLNSCVAERLKIKSFPFVRFFYVIGSFVFLGVTLSLNLAQVSLLVWGSIVLCNFVLIFAIADAR